MRVLLLGDSLFARYEGCEEPRIEHALKHYCSDMTIANWAVSGDNSDDLLGHLRAKELPRADRVFVFIGANDLAQHKQVFLGEYQANLHTIVTQLIEHFDPQTVCLMTPPPVDESKQRYRTNRLVAYYSNVVKQVAIEHGTAFLDTSAVFGQSELALADLLKGSLDDGLHFGSQAYDLLARAMVALLD